MKCIPRLGYSDESSAALNSTIRAIRDNRLIVTSVADAGGVSLWLEPTRDGVRRAEFLRSPWYGKTWFWMRPHIGKIAIAAIVALLTFWLKTLSFTPASDDSAQPPRIEQRTTGEKSPAVVSSGDVTIRIDDAEQRLGVGGEPADKPVTSGAEEEQ